jgi:hypothetical protein
MTPVTKTNARRTLLAATALACAAALSGCLERTISISSEPPGALVRLNDVEVGRTPLDVDFTFYGTYDVRLDLDGYEPIVTSRKASAPIYEYPGLDLVAEAIPTTIETNIRWHFDLRPTIEAVLPADRATDRLLERARAFQSQATGGSTPQSTPPAAPPPTSDAGTPTTTDAGATGRTTTPPAPTTPP